MLEFLSAHRPLPPGEACAGSGAGCSNSNMGRGVPRRGVCSLDLLVGVVVPSHHLAFPDMKLSKAESSLLPVLLSGLRTLSPRSLLPMGGSFPQSSLSASKASKAPLQMDGNLPGSEL